MPPNDQSLYEDSSDSADPLDSTDTGADKSEMSDEPQTALLPKNFFGGKDLEPGRECKVKIKKVYDDEVQVEYVAHGTNDDEGASDSAPEDREMSEAMEDTSY